MTTLFANNVITQSAQAIDTVQTTISVLDASKFPAGVSPADPIWVTLSDIDSTLVEITLCTAVSGNVLTVVRGQDGTPAQSHPLGTYVEARLVRAVFTELQGDIAGRAPLVHTHVEADITDLDKTEEAPVNGLSYTRRNAAWQRGSAVFHQDPDPIAGAQIGDVWIPVT